MGRHTAERGPANDLFMATVLAALFLLCAIILALAAN
jgi:preprotein translocase subunit SecG